MTFDQGLVSMVQLLEKRRGPMTAVLIWVVLFCKGSVGRFNSIKRSRWIQTKDAERRLHIHAAAGRVHWSVTSVIEQESACPPEEHLSPRTVTITRKQHKQTPLRWAIKEYIGHKITYKSYLAIIGNTSGVNVMSAHRYQQFKCLKVS